jgi:hypothetical protein
MEDVGHRVAKMHQLSSGCHDEVAFVRKNTGIQRMIDQLFVGNYHTNAYFYSACHWLRVVEPPDGLNSDGMPRHALWMSVFRVHRSLALIGLNLEESRDEYLEIADSFLRRSTLKPAPKFRVQPIEEMLKRLAKVYATIPVVTTIFLVPNTSFDMVSLGRQMFGLFLAYNSMARVDFISNLHTSDMTPQPTGATDFIEVESILRDLIGRENIDTRWTRLMGMIDLCSSKQAPKNFPPMEAFEYWFCEAFVGSEWCNVIYDDMMKKMVSCRPLDLSSALAEYLSLPNRTPVFEINDWCYVDLASVTSGGGAAAAGCLALRAKTEAWHSYFGFDKNIGTFTFMTHISKAIENSVRMLKYISGAPIGETTTDDNFQYLHEFYPKSGAFFDPQQFHHSSDMVNYFTTGLPTFCCSPALFKDAMEDVSRQLFANLYFLPDREGIKKIK